MWVNLYECEYGLEAVVHQSQEEAFECLDAVRPKGYSYRETIAKTPTGWVSVDLEADLDEWRLEVEREQALADRHNATLRYPGV
jgi:hypothetical protein